MYKLTLLLIPLILLSSCTTDGNDEKDYYKDLYSACDTGEKYEKPACINSIKEMEAGGYKKAGKTSSGYICPQGMRQNGFRTVGAIWWCEPIEKTTTSEQEAGNTTLSGSK